MEGKVQMESASISDRHKALGNDFHLGPRSITIRLGSAGTRPDDSDSSLSCAKLFPRKSVNSGTRQEAS